jgi:hypothetical protein
MINMITTVLDDVNRAVWRVSGGHASCCIVASWTAATTTAMLLSSVKLIHPYSNRKTITK